MIDEEISRSTIAISVRASKLTARGLAYALGEEAKKIRKSQAPQGMFILVCVAIYAVLIQGIATSGDPIGAIWGTIGYTVLLCFMLFKTGGIAQRVFGAH